MRDEQVIRHSPAGGFDLHLEDEDLVRRVAVALRLMDRATVPGSRIEKLSGQVDYDLSEGVLEASRATSRAFWSTDNTAAGLVNLLNVSDEDRRILEDALKTYALVLPKRHVAQESLRALRASLKESS